MEGLFLGHRLPFQIDFFLVFDWYSIIRVKFPTVILIGVPIILIGVTVLVLEGVVSSN